MFYRTNTEFAYEKTLKALSKYNRLAYKKIIFEILPMLRNGELVGTPIAENTYKIPLPSSPQFIEVHGEISLVYSIIGDELWLRRIEPYEVLMNAHAKLVSVIDGVPITSPKDEFKMKLIKARKEQDHEHKRSTKKVHK